MEPLRLMTRTLLIPIKELKVNPLCTTNNRSLDFIKDQRIVVAAFQEVVYRCYKVVPLSGAVENPGVEGSTSSLIAQSLSEQGIGIGRGPVSVNPDELSSYLKELHKQVENLLSRYGLYFLADCGNAPGMLDHGFVTEQKTYCGRPFIQFSWWVGYLNGTRKTVLELLHHTMRVVVPYRLLENVIERYTKVPISVFFTSGENTTWHELSDSVLRIGEN